MEKRNVIVDDGIIINFKYNLELGICEWASYLHISVHYVHCRSMSKHLLCRDTYQK